MSGRTLREARGEHCLNLFISFELKDKIRKLAERYDRTMADMVRALLKIGVPMMEGISDAEEIMVKEYIKLFRKFRKIGKIKEI